MNFDEIKKTRVYLYVVFGVTYFIIYKILGFEYTTILILTTILGEIHHQFENLK